VFAQVQEIEAMATSARNRRRKVKAALSRSPVVDAPEWTKLYRVDEVIECLPLSEACVQTGYKVGGRKSVEKELLKLMPDAYETFSEGGEDGEPDSDPGRKLSVIWDELATDVQDVLSKAWEIEETKYGPQGAKPHPAQQGRPDMPEGKTRTYYVWSQVEQLGTVEAESREKAWSQVFEKWPHEKQWGCELEVWEEPPPDELTKEDQEHQLELLLFVESLFGGASFQFRERWGDKHDPTGVWYTWLSSSGGSRMIGNDDLLVRVREKAEELGVPVWALWSASSYDDRMVGAGNKRCEHCGQWIVVASATADSKKLSEVSATKFSLAFLRKGPKYQAEADEARKKAEEASKPKRGRKKAEEATA